jgi:hypothetical protein
MWYRIFARSEAEVPPTALLEHLHTQGRTVRGTFRGDDLGWIGAELSLGEGTPVYVERYVASEEGFRADLNTWAAWLETADYSPNSGPLMEHVIQTKQLFILRKPIDHADEVTVERLCLETCRFLAERGDGVYQIDGQGWFAADGTMVLQEY